MRQVSLQVRLAANMKTAATALQILLRACAPLGQRLLELSMSMSSSMMCFEEQLLPARVLQKASWLPTSTRLPLTMQPMRCLR